MSTFRAWSRAFIVRFFFRFFSSADKSYKRDEKKLLLKISSVRTYLAHPLTLVWHLLLCKVRPPDVCFWGIFELSWLDGPHQVQIGLQNKSS